MAKVFVGYGGKQSQSILHKIGNQRNKCLLWLKRLKSVKTIIIVFLLKRNATDAMKGKNGNPKRNKRTKTKRYNIVMDQASSIIKNLFWWIKMDVPCATN